MPNFNWAILLFLICAKCYAEVEDTDSFDHAFKEAQQIEMQDDISLTIKAYKRALQVYDTEKNENYYFLVLMLKRLVYLYDKEINKSKPGAYEDSLSFQIRDKDLDAKAYGQNSIEVSRDCFAIGMRTKKAKGSEASLPFFECYIETTRIREGEKSNEFGSALNTYADLLLQSNRIEESEQTFSRSLKILANIDPLSKTYITGLSKYSNFLFQSGRYEEYELTLYKVLELISSTEGESSENYLFHQGALINFYLKWQKFAEADNLIWKRYVKVSKDKPDSFVAALTYWLAGDASLRAGQIDEALELFEKSLDLHVRIMPSNYPHLGSLKVSLAQAYMLGNYLEKATHKFKEALDFFKSNNHEQYTQVAIAYMELGRIELARKNFSEALNNFSAVNVICYNASFSKCDYISGQTAYLMYLAQLNLGDLNAARQSFEQVIDSIYLMYERSENLLIDTSYAKSTYRPILFSYLNFSATKTLSYDRIFEVIQFTNINDTSTTLRGMSVRSGIENDSISTLVRQYQDDVVLLKKIDIDLLSLSTGGDASRVHNLNQQKKILLKKYHEDIQALDQSFPLYRKLTDSSPVLLEHLQSSMVSREALVQFLFDDDDGYVVLVKKNEFYFYKLPLSGKQLLSQIKMLRRGLVLQSGTPAEFDTKLSHELYKQIFSPIENHLQGIEFLTVIPDGALKTIPLSILISKKPSLSHEYQNIDWLFKKFNLNVFPSISSFVALRGLSNTSSTWMKTLGGIGDPNFGSSLSLLGKFNISNNRSQSSNISFSRLPDTRKELQSVAKSYNSKAEDLLLGDNATEQKVKEKNWVDYKIIVFATHGLMKDEVPGLDEPALLLSKSQASEGEDGFLRASEIAKLKLTADWVILSACNTAAPDGSVKDDFLSGLAKSFFYSGAKSILASNWYVNSQATKKLVTAMLNYYSIHPQEGKAKALTQGILTLFNDKSNKYNTHPAFWAPFVLVGDGIDN